MFMKGARIRGLLVSLIFAAAFCCILWVSLSSDKSTQAAYKTETALVVSLEDPSLESDFARDDTEPENISDSETVYYTFFEETYHSRADCEQIDTEFEVLSTTLEQAEKMGLKPCLSCQKNQSKIEG